MVDVIITNVIARLHQPDVDAIGGNSGFCAECDWAWPCRTWHLAAGHGHRDDCEEQGWCEHAGVPVSPAS